MIDESKRDGVTTLSMCHGKANAMDIEFLEALVAALRRAEQAGGAIVLTGGARMFSAGIDLKRIVDGGHDYVEPFLSKLLGTFEVLLRCELPVVAAVNGHAIAGGCVLAACADYRVATDNPNAKIGISEHKVGVPFPGLVLEIMRHVVPAHRLNALVLKGDLLNPEEALRSGLVDEVVAPEGLAERAHAVAAELGATAPEVYALTKRQLRAPLLAQAEELVRGHGKDVKQAWTSDGLRAAVSEYVKRTMG